MSTESDLVTFRANVTLPNGEGGTIAPGTEFTARRDDPRAKHRRATLVGEAAPVAAETAPAVDEVLNGIESATTAAETVAKAKTAAKAKKAAETDADAEALALADDAIDGAADNI